MQRDSSPWRTLSSDPVHDTEHFTVHHDRAENIDAGIRDYTWLRHKAVGIAVLPVDEEGNTFLIGQHRYPTHRFTWELVRGAGALDRPAEDAARRELQEETGLIAERWLKLFDLMATPGTSDEIAPCFLAWGLSQHRSRPDPQEQLHIRQLPFRQAVAEALDGTIVDAASVALILGTYAHLLQGDLPRDAGERLKKGI